MGFLHKLWDETLAGPTPETGLGKLRKYDSFPATTTRPRPVVLPDDVVITRSITILKRNNNNNCSGFRNSSADPGSAPDSPAGPSTPRTPLTQAAGTPPGDFKRFTRRKSSAEAFDRTALDPTSPTIYDWTLISALDS